MNSISAKEWVMNWKVTGPELERLRVDAHKSAKLSETMLSLCDAAKSALLAHPPKPTSGIIEMQRLFAKLRT